MKKCFIFHGWKENPESAFFPWLREELQSEGYEVTIPQLPNADMPKVQEWVSFIENVLEDADEDSLLIAHSLGGTALLKYLEKRTRIFSFRKVILIAPAINEVTNIPEAAQEMAEPWLQLAFDEKEIQKSVKELVGFFSDDDPRVPLRTEKVFRERFGGKTFIEQGKGHYSKPHQQPNLETLKEIVSL